MVVFHFLDKVQFTFFRQFRKVCLFPVAPLYARFFCLGKKAVDTGIGILDIVNGVVAGLLFRQVNIAAKFEDAGRADSRFYGRALVSITRCKYCFSGSAYTTSTAILCDTVNLFGAGRERLNHIRGQLFKDAAKRQLNQLIGKLKVQMELNTAGVRAQWGKLPAPHQRF